MTEALFQLRQILRSLRRSPGYALAAMLTLSVGLTGALAALAPAWDLLGHPFDLADPGDVVCLSGEGPAGASFLRPLSARDFWDLQREVSSLQGVGATRDSTVDLRTEEGTRQVRTGLVSPGFFQVLGMPLALGRGFTEAEGRPGGASVVVLTHSFWMATFGGDRGVLGRTLVLEGVAHEVVGVLAPQSRLPFFLGDAVTFQPLVFRGGETGRTMASCWVFGRLAKGATVAQLQVELDRLVPTLGPPRPAGDLSWGIKARGLLAYWRARLAPALAATTLSGLLILLLACANAAHLMLARNLDRTREWGLRTALGARALGLGLPILTEAFVLCSAAALLSLPLLALLQALEVLHMPVLGGSVLMSMAVALVASILMTACFPLRWASRLDLTEALREGGTASASRGSNVLRGGLAVVQLALAFALLVGAGMSLRALERMQRLDPGYDLRHLSVALVTVRAQGDALARNAAFQREVLQSLEGNGAIQAVALSNTRPLVDQGNGGNVWGEGGQGALEAGQHAVSPAYFKTLGIPLLAGRVLEDSDRDACVVSLQLARRFWGETSALGQRVHLGGIDRPALTVVGVVGEARMGRLAREAAPAVYTSLARQGAGYLTVYLRSAAPGKALQELVQGAIQKADPEARLREFQSLEGRAARELEEPSRLRWQTLAAGLLAALLAGVGLAGTLAQAAARQKREWGIRLALGATPARLSWLVFRRVGRLLMAGLVLGSGFAWALGRVLEHQFQGVDGLDPWLILMALVGLGATGFLAGLTPALRAARVHPAEALRSE